MGWTKNHLAATSYTASPPTVPRLNGRSTQVPVIELVLPNLQFRYLDRTWKLPSEIARIQPRNRAHAPSPGPAPKRLENANSRKSYLLGASVSSLEQENPFPHPSTGAGGALKESPTAARRLIWSPRGSFKVDHPVLNS